MSIMYIISLKSCHVIPSLSTISLITYSYHHCYSYYIMFTHYCHSYRLPRKHIITSFAYFCHSLAIICINHVKLLTCNHERHCHCTVSLFSVSVHALRMQQIIMSLSFTYSFHFHISLQSHNHFIFK